MLFSRELLSYSPSQQNILSAISQTGYQQFTEKGGFMKAKDLMIPLQEYLTPDNTLKEAVNLLRIAKRGEEKIGLKGLPVLDKDGKLIGMLSMTDILKAVRPAYMSLMNLSNFSWEGMIESLAKDVADNKVDGVMSKIVITVKDDDSLMECVDLMLKNNIKRLPVIDNSGKAVGMLYERDIFFAVVRAMLQDDYYVINS
jgi:CBS domain-containing protein